MTLKADRCAENDERILCWTPVGRITEILEDGNYRVENESTDETSVYKKSEITKFLLLVELQEDESFLAIYDDFYEPLDLITVRDLYSGDTRNVHADWLQDGITIIKDPTEFIEHERRFWRHYESAENLGAMREVSKKGVMAHLPLPNNVKGKIISYVSGYNVGVPNETAHMKILQEYMTRARGAPGAGVNTRYGRELPLPPKPPLPPNISELNKALSAGPLPHGPTEENFMGGKRKSRGRVGKQMARRGTRRSRGIFSRLYSPIGHLLSAGKESVGAVTNTAKGVVGEGVHGLDRIGRSVTKHANMAVKDVFTRKGGKRRGSRKNRKNRKTRRNNRY